MGKREQTEPTEQESEETHQEGRAQEVEDTIVSEEETRAAELEKQLGVCQAQLVGAMEQCRRASADLTNYEKRVGRERERWARDARTMVLRELLPVIDNFERALSQPDDEQSDATGSLQEGMELIYQQLKKVCDKFNVKVMDNYDTFDPEYHEAIAHVNAEGVASGAIVDIAQQGYLIDGVVLRHAQVVVAK